MGGYTDRLAPHQLHSVSLERERHEGAYVFVDFDHTLFAGNSTELFIASCKPAAIVALLDFLIRRCVPWRLTRLKHWFRLRDYACCIAILLILPWNFLIWKRIAPRLFQQFQSREVSDLLSAVDRSQLILVSFGMRAIIAPLLGRSHFRAIPLIATPLLSVPTYFAQGKLLLVRKQFDADKIANSAFLTDSLEDDDLLRAAKAGILIEPQGDRFSAAERLYLPLRYTAAAKYTPSYVFDQIFLLEMLLTIVSTASSLRSAGLELLFVPFFTLSLMCVYEIGYFENDFVAAKHESRPTLGARVARYAEYPIQPAAWVWSLATAAVGISVAYSVGEGSATELPRTAALWIAALVVLRILFRVYNRPGMQGRIVLYPVLQLMKYAPLLLLLHATVAGAIMVLCQITTMWAIYLSYRLTAVRNPFQKEAFRTALFGLAVCLLATSCTLRQLGGASSLALLLCWSVARLTKAPCLKLLRQYRKGVIRTS
jgi:hypothetical protein